MSETANTIHDMPDLKRWWEGSPLDKALSAIENNKDPEVIESWDVGFDNTLLALSVNLWDPVSCNWEVVWSVWTDENENYVVVFDDPNKTITPWSKIEINWKEAEIVNDGNVISLVWNLNEVEVVADSLFNGITPRPAKPIEMSFWNESLNPIATNRDSILNLDNMYWIKVWDIVFVEWEKVWQVWFNETIWLHVDFDENHKTIENNKKVTIWGFEFKILEKGMLSPLITLPEIAVVDSPIENGEGTWLRLEDITVALWNNLNKEIFIDTINDVTANWTTEQMAKVAELMPILKDPNKNNDWSSPMVKLFQKNELSLNGQQADWVLGGVTFDKMQKWLWIIPKNRIRTKDIFDNNKQIYKIRSTKDLNNKFSNFAVASLTVNTMMQNINWPKKFLFSNDWKVIIPDNLIWSLNSQDENQNIYTPESKIGDWELMDNWDINISQNGYHLTTIDHTARFW